MLSKSCIQKLCAGQVIVDLASVVKELLENALDANASNIEIRFRNNGVDGVEVTDNGHGIEIEDLNVLEFGSTSKLREFHDIDLVSTYGFRGEALSSLCQVAKVTISSKTKTSPGFKMDMQTREKQLAAMNEGTTVMIRDLFHNLPVRKQEFERNAAREYARALNLLQNYALIVNSRILVSHVRASSRVVFVTPLGGLEKNFVAIFGSHLLTKLNEPIVEGLISTAVGRQTSDRQFVYLNQRPVDAPKITKLINLNFKKKYPMSYPIFALNIKWEADINLTPNKRMVFFKNMDSLLEQMDAIMQKVFEPDSIKLPLKRTFYQQESSKVSFVDNSQNSIPVELSQASSSESSNNDSLIESVKESPIEKTQSLPISQTLGTDETTFIEDSQTITEDVLKLSIDESNIQPLPPLETREISKLDFLSMKIVGQFNRGFIITELNNELYIFDQHASDEKSKFENLMSRELMMQPLIKPINLQDKLPHEILWEVEKINGFEVKNNFLLKVPMIEGMTFSYLDLLSAVERGGIGDRMRGFFAYKSCRSSVMIGTSLNKKQMQKIISNLANLKHPWNCPHGRPTMRHLCKLKQKIKGINCDRFDRK